MTEAEATSKPRFALTRPFGRLTAIWLATPLCLFPAFTYALSTRVADTESYFLLRQDLPVLVLIIAIVAALGLVRVSMPARVEATATARPRLRALGLAAGVLAIGVIGAPLVFQGYVLSLDEFMANFDAQIFAHGQGLAPVAPAWRPFVPALQPMFLLPIPDHSFWASAYLPVNAASRALAGLVGLQSWVNPLWSGVSVLATWGVGRRLWPERPGMALGAAALLATSAQLLITAMTAYAMPGHLALNMIWLWCFLRGGRLGHAGAVVAGFLACGLHQLAFHPMFAAPFVLQLWLDRRWRLAGFYTVAYAAIGLFWIGYWPLEMRLEGVAAQTGPSLGGGWLVQRLLAVLAQIRFLNLIGMALSLIRFVTWQSLLTAPLAIAGAAAAWRAKGHLRALLGGIVLTILAMLILSPTQTDGWGYRYLHGLMGSACLLAAWSWTRLTDPLPTPARRAAKTAFALACAISLLALAPLRAWQAWSYVRPYAAANAAIQASAAPVVLVDDGDGRWFDMGALVRNDPYLERGPKVMRLADLTDIGVRQVCAAGPVAIFDGATAQAAGIDLAALPPDPATVRLRALMSELKCGTPIP